MSESARFLQALESEQPIWRLREEVQRLLSAGHDRETVLSQLESLRHTLQVAGRDADEDIVLDVMDYLTGWCSPDMQL